MCSPCLYLCDYVIFTVTTDSEQNWGLWKVISREQQDHNSNESSWGGLSGSCPSAVLGECFHKKIPRGMASTTFAAAGQRSPTAAKTGLEQLWSKSKSIPSSGITPLACAGFLPLLHACGSGSEAGQAGWCLQPQLQQLVVKPPRAVPAACLLTAVPSWVNLGTGNCLCDIFNLCPECLKRTF